MWLNHTVKTLTGKKLVVIFLNFWNFLHFVVVILLFLKFVNMLDYFNLLGIILDFLLWITTAVCCSLKVTTNKSNNGSGKRVSLGQLPVTSSSSVIKGRNRSTSTFSTASSASACYSFHHLNPDNEYGNGGDGSDLPMGCQTSSGSKSQPCSHHPSFSGPSSVSR